jgi:uncharacterized protein YkwD
VRRSYVLPLPILFLSASLTLACTSTSPTATAGSGEEAASAGADQVLVTTLVPLPTRTPEPATPTQQPAPTLAAPTSTLVPATATSTPQPTLTPILVASPAATLTPLATDSPAPTAILTGSTVLSSREQAIFVAHNAERSSRGISPLSSDPTLQTIARARAQIMADNNLFSHYAPNGDTIYDMFDDAGYDWDDATENIHFNDVPLSQADAWAMNEYMASAPHRASILKPGFQRIGIGVAASASGVHYYSVVLSD